jgi:hypothetical protein
MASDSTNSGYASHDHLDDAEKGLYDRRPCLPALPPLSYTDQKNPIHLNASDIGSHLSPFSPIHEGLTPKSSVPVLSFSWAKGWQASDALAPKSLPLDAAGQVKKPAKVKQKVDRWILFQLWFNTYKKFFTLVTLLNTLGIIMATLGRFRYANEHLGALVLGNLLMAILMRNELFLRFLYITAIYGLRSVRLHRALDNKDL